MSDFLLTATMCLITVIGAAVVSFLDDIRKELRIANELKINELKNQK